MSEPVLQLGFSKSHNTTAFDKKGRERKAAKVIAILHNAIGSLNNLQLLDIGCSTGFMSRFFAEQFMSVVAIDIDEPAISFAMKNNCHPNIEYLVMDSMTLGFPSEHFDVVICTHIYEHVPDPTRLLDEIYRVLKPGGVCFFSAGNRISWIEPHYRLPLLSVIPKWTANHYLRLLGLGSHYYETHLSYWGLKALVKRFTLVDYTVKVIDDPELFAADDILIRGSLKQRLASSLIRALYWLCPTYLWLLFKSSSP